ncbi:MAG: hypothetical protein IJ197_09375 [Bacteroidaceae bacterium]|nr:hypothetical protein [Bacteroidaceae bacterium]
MKKFFQLFFCLSALLPVQAQIPDTEDQEVFAAQVSLVDEFVHRFNGEEYHPLVQKDSVGARRKNLLFLLDLARYKSRNDTAFIRAEKFVDKVLADSVVLHYADTAWLATALCHATLQGKPVDITLRLRVEHRKGHMYKWVITSAGGDCLSLASPKAHEPFMLMPDDHETNFMSLCRMASETAPYITDFADREARVDALTAFMTLVRYGLLKIDYVSELQFTFFQVPGYVFTIANTDRNTKNTGWLISEITAMPETDKETLYRKMTKGL